MDEPAVRFVGITKRFPGAVALADVTFEIAAGSCHGLCGENGAGKSTLGKVLAGIHAPDAGRLFVRGREVRFSGPRDALAAGVGMVHQELAFCANLSVAENLCLGSLPRRGWLVQPGETERRARAMLEEIGQSLDVRRPLGDLALAQQQLVQIAAAVGSGARLIVFDEPTSSLTEFEAERLYDLIGRLKRRAVTCVYVSHRMPELFRLCDAVTVLRDGRHVATETLGALEEAGLVRLMIGRPLADYFPAHVAAAPGEEALRVDGLTIPGTPREAIRLGIGLVPEDRKRQGLVLQESCRRNVSLPILPTLARFSWVRTLRERALASHFFERLRVRAAGIDAAVGGCSGGNQQKIVLAKWLAAESRVLILDEPTRGVDVGAKAEMHALIDQLARQGTAILLISSELPELIALSTRILVLRAGRLVGEVPRSAASQDQLLRLMAGVGAEGGAGAGEREGERKREGSDATRTPRVSAARPASRRE
jgi:ABC-type sugar transport system ATPase subunit